MTTMFAEVDFDDPPKPGTGKVLFRISREHLAKVDRAATILCMSREQFIRTVLWSVAEQFVEQATPKDGTTPTGEAKSRKSASYDPTKPPGT